MRPLLFKDTTWFSQGYQYSLNTTHFYSGIQERHQIQRTTCELSNCDFILPSTSFDIAAPFAVQKIDAHGQHLWVEFEKGSCILLTVAKGNIEVVGCFFFFFPETSVHSDCFYSPRQIRPFHEEQNWLFLLRYPLLHSVTAHHPSPLGVPPPCSTKGRSVSSQLVSGEQRGGWWIVQASQGNNSQSACK